MPLPLNEDIFVRKLLFTIICSLLLLSFATTASARIHSNVYGPTESSDHLWQIALETRPSEFITPQQMMVALVNRNPHAFKNHNVNGLYSGVYLHLPSLSQIRAISPNQAIATIMNQNKLWQQNGLPAPTIIATPEKKVVKVKAVPAKAVAPVAAMPIKTKQEFMALQANVTMMMDQFQQFMLVSNQRDRALAENDDIMHKQLVAMSGTVQQLSTQIENQRSTLNNLIETNSQEHIAWQQQLEEYALIGAVIGGCLLLLLALTWAKLLRNRQAQVATSNDASQTAEMTADEDKDLEDEYDFINSAEGIPAKLDLARAYIDMDDVESAKDVLQEVITRGNSLQIQQAKQLLSHIAMPVAL